MATQAIQYPSEILSALGKEPEEFEEEAPFAIGVEILRDRANSAPDSPLNLRGWHARHLYRFSVNTVCRPLEKHLKNSKNLSQMQEKHLCEPRSGFRYAQPVGRDSYLDTEMSRY